MDIAPLIFAGPVAIARCALRAALGRPHPIPRRLCANPLVAQAKGMDSSASVMGAIRRHVTNLEAAGFVGPDGGNGEWRELLRDVRYKPVYYYARAGFPAAFVNKALSFRRYELTTRFKMVGIFEVRDVAHWQELAHYLHLSDTEGPTSESWLSELDVYGARRLDDELVCSLCVCTRFAVLLHPVQRILTPLCATCAMFAGEGGRHTALARLGVRADACMQRTCAGGRAAQHAWQDDMPVVSGRRNGREVLMARPWTRGVRP